MPVCALPVPGFRVSASPWSRHLAGLSASLVPGFRSSPVSAAPIVAGLGVALVAEMTAAPVSELPRLLPWMTCNDHAQEAHKARLTGDFCLTMAVSVRAFTKEGTAMIRTLVPPTVIGLFSILICGCAGLASGNNGLSATCSVGTDSDGVAGWTASFTNATSRDITILGYTALFFNQSGNQTGSQDAANPNFTVAAGNTISDAEYHSFLAPVPSGSASCRITNLNES